MNNQIEIKRSIWQLPFSGAAGALPWYAYHNGIVYPELGKIKQFLSNMNGIEGWHPGAMELQSDGSWFYKSDWADNMDHDRSIDPNDNDNVNNKVDLMYMRSGDKNYALGVLTNKTYNVESVDGCFPNVLYDDVNEMPNFDGLMNQEDKGLRHSEFWNLKIRGLNSGKYYITYFYPNNQSSPIENSSDTQNGPTISLKVDLPAEYDKYIVLFMARKKITLGC